MSSIAFTGASNETNTSVKAIAVEMSLDVPPTTLPSSSSSSELVLQDLRSFLSRNTPSSLFDKSATAVPVAAIKALLNVVERSRAETMMGLQDELRSAAEAMMRNVHSDSSSSSSSARTSSSSSSLSSSSRSHIALQSGCELFLKYVTRTFLEFHNFEACRQAVLERGQRFHGMSLAARDRIAVTGAPFVPAQATVLTHGWSRVVAAILLEASRTKHFDIIILEGRPDASGIKAAKSYAQEAQIPVTVILDSAMGYIMEQVDMVLIGAEGVLENGGVVNKIGSAAVAACARAHGKPVYVAAESYKFARLYPLHQVDVPNNVDQPLHFVDTTAAGTVSASTDHMLDSEHRENTSSLQTVPLDPSIKVLNPTVDFTPAKYITLLFTDLGVLTPSAVSDELIRLYQ